MRLFTRPATKDKSLAITLTTSFKQDYNQEYTARLSPRAIYSHHLREDFSLVKSSAAPKG